MGLNIEFDVKSAEIADVVSGDAWHVHVPGSYGIPGLVLVFDDASGDWGARFPFIANGYGSGSLTVKVHGYLNTNTGNVVFGAMVCAVTPGDSAAVDGEAYDTASTQTQAVPGTVKYPFTITITVSNTNSMADGDMAWIEIYRDADHASDTAAADFYCTHISLTSS